jgi:hypothetical protein
MTRHGPTAGVSGFGADCMKKKFLLSEAEGMGPLVRSILADVADAAAERVEAERHAKRAEALRSHKDYSKRLVYQQASQAVARADERISRCHQELEQLGVELVDAEDGVAGFPFKWSRNSNSRKVRKAYFLLKLSDDPMVGIQSWRFSGEREERRVPPHWLGQLSSPILAEVAFRS